MTSSGGSLSECLGPQQDQNDIWALTRYTASCHREWPVGSIRSNLLQNKFCFIGGPFFWTTALQLNNRMQDGSAKWPTLEITISASDVLTAEQWEEEETRKTLQRQRAAHFYVEIEDYRNVWNRKDLKQVVLERGDQEIHSIKTVSQPKRSSCQTRN